MFLVAGASVPVEELVRGVIVQSGNDAAVVFAESIAGSEDQFSEMMNQKARELGLTHSVFRNATGWPHPEGHECRWQEAERGQQTVAGQLAGDGAKVARQAALFEFQ